METTTLLLVAIGLLILLGGGFLLRVNKKTKNNVQTIFIGIRPSSRQIRIRKGLARMGQYVWKEPGGLEADVILNGSQVYDSPEGKVVLVDLDSYHQISVEQANQALHEKAKAKGLEGALAYQEPEKAHATMMAMGYAGVCVNDEDPVEVKQRNGTMEKIEPVWKRLPGTILNKMRKDRRWEQMNNIGGSLWMFLTRAMPLLIILSIVLGIVGLGFSIKAVTG